MIQTRDTGVRPTTITTYTTVQLYQRGLGGLVYDLVYGLVPVNMVIRPAVGIYLDVKIDNITFL